MGWSLLDRQIKIDIGRVWKLTRRYFLENPDRNFDNFNLPILVCDFVPQRYGALEEELAIPVAISYIMFIPSSSYNQRVWIEKLKPLWIAPRGTSTSPKSFLRYFLSGYCSILDRSLPGDGEIDNFERWLNPFMLRKESNFRLIFFDSKIYKML